jgi:hypothetical protein
METLYIEGLAPHGGPESCVDVPQGCGEALAGVRAGRAIEPRNQGNRGAHAVQEVEGNTAGGVVRESSVGPARSENRGMYGASMCENRESPDLPVHLVGGWAVPGNAEADAW